MENFHVNGVCFSLKWCIILKKSNIQLKTGFVQMGHICIRLIKPGRRTTTRLQKLS